MGIIIKADLETSEGPSQEVYARIESLSFNKVTSDIRFQITYWVDKAAAIKYNRTFIDEEIKPAIGLVQERVLYYRDENSEPEELIVPNLIKVKYVEEKNIELPIYINKDIVHEVPYVSFDEMGEEITKYRSVTTSERVQTGTKNECKKLILTDLNNVHSFSYKIVKETLSKLLPRETLIDS
tara:strand:+ start:2685 stop:3230 length:546 start_codon:yes stop_codon:yes gene_type:complete